MSKQYCRVNLIGDENGTYYGPFDDWEPATRFGEMVANLELESFTIVGEEDLPEGVTITNPEEVEMQDE